MISRGHAACGARHDVKQLRIYAQQCPKACCRVHVACAQQRQWRQRGAPMLARMALRRAFFSSLLSWPLKVLLYSGLLCASSFCCARRSCALQTTKDDGMPLTEPVPGTATAYWCLLLSTSSCMEAFPIGAALLP